MNAPQIILLALLTALALVIFRRKPQNPMKQLLLLASLCALFTVGCVNPGAQAPVTIEAQRYVALRDTWTTTLALYDHAKDLQVAGKISARDAADIDAAWNVFRANYKVALMVVQGNQNAFTPDSVKKLANDVITLIYAATN